MTKTRLRVGHRDWLYRFMESTVTLDYKRGKLDAAYLEAAPLVLSVVESKFPPDDMKILKKYNKAVPDACIKVILPVGGVEQFDFRPGDEPLVAKQTYNGQTYLIDDDETATAIQKWVKERDKFKEQLDSLIKDYKSLIYGSRTFEDVVSVWPEAEALRGQICGVQLPSTITPELANRIKRDMRTRAKLKEQADISQ